MTISLNNPSKGGASGGTGGVSDHSLLSNLDYASAAHTGFEPAISAGTGTQATQYWRGDKVWAVLNTAGGAGGTTDHAALVSLDSASAGHTGYQATILSNNLIGTAPIGITGGTGSVLSATTITISTATASLTGALASGDWTTFNSKQATITSTNVIGTANQILVSGGTGAILAATTLSLPQSIDTAGTPTFGDLTLTGTSGNIIDTALIKGAVEELDDSLCSNKETGFGAWTSGDTSAVYTITGGGAFQIDRPGYGYINGKKVTWASGQTTGVLAANTFYWVYIDTNGILQTNSNFITDSIRLFEVLYDGTIYVVAKENHPKEFQSTISGYAHTAIGTIVFSTGSNITKVANGTGASADDRRVKIVGADTLSDHGLNTTIPDSAGAGVTWNIFYRVGGKWIRYAQQTEIPPYYNSGGTATALDVVNAYGEYVLYAAKDTIEVDTPQYIAVMGESSYTTLPLVLAAITSGSSIFSTNELKSIEAAQLGYAVVQYSVGGGYITQVNVAKSTLNQQYVGGGGGAGADHSLLSNLSYASAGHVGFQATVTSANLICPAPLAVTGGTGAMLNAQVVVSCATANMVGTANQISVSGGSGALMAATTLSLPQDIGTASNVNFAGVHGDSTGTFSNILAGISIFTSIIAGGETSYFNAISVGAMVISSFPIIVAGQKLILDGA